MTYENESLSTLFPPAPGAKIPDEATSMAAVVRSWGHREILSSRLAYRERYRELFAERLSALRSDLGLGDLLLPESRGGLGLNTSKMAPGAVTILIELACADASLAAIFALEYAVEAMVTLEPRVDDQLCALVANRARDGIALALPGAGIIGEETALFRGRSLRARLAHSGSSWSVAGDSLRVFGASPGEGTILVVACSDDAGGPCLAFVDGHSKGINWGSPLKTTGLEAIPMCDVTLDGVAIDESRILRGGGALTTLMVWLDLLFGAVSLGATTNFFDILSRWSEDRCIKGRAKLKENPLCAALLAEVAGELAVSTLLVYDLAEMVAEDVAGDEGEPTEKLFAFAQLLGSKVQRGAFTAIDRGLELMGSAGYAKEWHAEKHWRDVKTIKSLLCGSGGEIPAQLDGARYFVNCEKV